MIYVKIPGKAMWFQAEDLRKDPVACAYIFNRNYLDESGSDPFLLFVTPGKTLAPNNLQYVELEPLLIMETADVDGSKESILNWVDKYGFPVWANIHRGSFEMRDGRHIFLNLSLTELRMLFAKVRAAAILWQGLAENDISAIRRYLKCDGNVLVVSLEYNHGVTKVTTDIPEFEVDLSNQSSEAFLSKAAEVLAWLINDGLYHFSPKTSIEVKYHKDCEDEVSGFEAVVDGIDPVSFIWITLKDMLCESDWENWKFRRCENCGTWIDLIPPKHRKTRTRCDDCAVQHDKEGNNRRAKESQKKRKSS